MIEFPPQNSQTLLLDGAIGTAIIERTHSYDHNLWTSGFNLTDSEIVKSVHLSYLEAGADIITTNTFRTNYTAFIQSGIKISYSDFVKAGVKPALDTKEKFLSTAGIVAKTIIIAGSNSPAEDCYQKDRTLSPGETKTNHEMHIMELMNSGVDIILNETHSHLDEIEIICGVCEQLHAPYIISLYLDDNLSLLSGESIEVALEMLSRYSPNLICFNCISPLQFSKLLKRINLPVNWGYYLNCGIGNLENGIIECSINEDEYQRIAEDSLKYNPKLIGGCCGSNYKHIKSLRKLLDEKSVHEIAR